MNGYVLVLGILIAVSGILFVWILGKIAFRSDKIYTELVHRKFDRKNK